MNKAIILISGTPDSKKKFVDLAKKEVWLWNVDLHNFLGSKKNGFYWDGDRSQDYNNFTIEFFAMVYKYFMLDDSEFKLNVKRTFDKFILIVHGVSKELDTKLKDEYGVFRILITQSDETVNMSLYDLILFDDNENFELEVNRVVSTLTK